MLLSFGTLKLLTGAVCNVDVSVDVIVNSTVFGLKLLVFLLVFSGSYPQLFVCLWITVYSSAASSVLSYTN